MKKIILCLITLAVFVVINDGHKIQHKKFEGDKVYFYYVGNDDSNECSYWNTQLVIADTTKGNLFSVPMSHVEWVEKTEED
jgi:hypothetical protein